MRREPRPLKEERKCFGVAEPEKRGKVGRGAVRARLRGRGELQWPAAERGEAPCRHKAAAIFAGGGGPSGRSESGGGRA